MDSTITERSILSVDQRAYRKVVPILRVLDDADQPLGSTRIARELHAHGIDLSHRTIRYYLLLMDQTGLTHSLGKRGREITLRGKMELRGAETVDRVGFLASTVDAMAYRMAFDLQRWTGKVIVNVSLVDAADLQAAVEEMIKVYNAGLGIGRFAAVATVGERLGGFEILRGKRGIATICSITINGVLLKAGIATHSRFGSLLEIRHNRPHRFTQIINYDGTSIDPLEIFIRGKMTEVHRAVNTGTGIVGASFREVPTAAVNEVERINTELERTGLGGALLIGRPNQQVLDVPVMQGRTGMIVMAGLNPIAAVEERGISTINWAMKTMMSLDRLVPIDEMQAIASKL